MISAAVPSVQTVRVPGLLCLKGTCGEDTRGHLPFSLPCESSVHWPSVSYRRRGGNAGPSPDSLWTWGWAWASEIAGVIQGVHLHFIIEQKFQRSHCMSASFLSRNTCFSLINAINPIGSSAYASASGWFLVAENLPWSWSYGAGYPSLMLLDF